MSLRMTFDNFMSVLFYQRFRILNDEEMMMEIIRFNNNNTSRV